MKAKRGSIGIAHHGGRYAWAVGVTLVKVKVTLEQVLEAGRGSRDIALLFL
jgi:hypothetical protein